MILFFFFPNDTSIISISKRCQNRMGINCFCFPAVAPFIGFVQYRPIPVKSSTFETGERDSELTRYRAFFFFLPPFFRHASILFAIRILSFSPSPNFQPRIISYHIAVLCIYIYVYIFSSALGTEKQKGKLIGWFDLPDNLSLIRDDLAIIGGRISRYILLLKQIYLCIIIHAYTRSCIFDFVFLCFFPPLPPPSSFYFDRKAIYFSTAFERAYDFLVFCDKRWLLNRTTISELVFYYALRFFFFSLLYTSPTIVSHTEKKKKEKKKQKKQRSSVHALNVGNVKFELPFSRLLGGFRLYVRPELSSWRTRCKQLGFPVSYRCQPIGHPSEIP